MQTERETDGNERGGGDCYATGSFHTKSHVLSNAAISVYFFLCLFHSMNKRFDTGGSAGDGEVESAAI